MCGVCVMKGWIVSNFEDKVTNTLRSSYEQVKWKTIFIQYSHKWVRNCWIDTRYLDEFFDFISGILVYKVITKQINDCIIAYNTYLEIISYDINSAFRGIFILIRKHIWKHFHVDVNLRVSSDYQQNIYYDSVCNYE